MDWSCILLLQNSSMTFCLGKLFFLSVHKETAIMEGAAARASCSLLSIESSSAPCFQALRACGAACGRSVERSNTLSTDLCDLADWIKVAAESETPQTCAGHHGIMQGRLQWAFPWKHMTFNVFGVSEAALEKEPWSPSHLRLVILPDPLSPRRARHGRN